MRAMSFLRAVSVLAMASLARAWDPPSYGGYSLVWADTFPSAAGTLPSADNWNIITGYLGVNAEWELYTASPRNVQCSGGQTLQLVPWRDASARDGWTSGRVESRYAFTPAAGRVTRAEAEIRFGAGPVGAKQGLWPAFWLLGDALRRPGGSWPACGEVDALETVGGALTGYGTAHCGTYPGGVCNEGAGIGGSVAIPDQGWHTWRVEWDRRPGTWQAETIKWYMDGRLFHTITGGQLPQDVWSTLAHSPMYFILNMAVGGTWPGYPNAATLDGYGSMMEVAYVAQYVST